MAKNKVRNHEFDGVDIPDDRARALVAGIIRDAIQSYAKQLFRKKQHKEFSEKEIIDCELFFQSEDYQNYADALNLKMSGIDLMRMIKQNPRKYFKAKEKKNAVCVEN